MCGEYKIRLDKIAQYKLEEYADKENLSVPDAIADLLYVGYQKEGLLHAEKTVGRLYDHFRVMRVN